MRAGATRLSLETPSDLHTGGNNNNFYIGSGRLPSPSSSRQGLFRFSPPATQLPRFFPENINNKNSTSQYHQPHQQQQQQQYQSNINGSKASRELPHLRKLAARSSFFASLLYSQTKSFQDALQLAQLQYHEQQYGPCLRVLEESRLLQSEVYTWEALLLACQALAAQQDWTALLEIVEDACRILPQSTDHINSETGFSYNNNTFRALAMSQPLEDDDVLGWKSLYDSIGLSSKLDSSTSNPLPSILYWRGQAYQATGNGSRAALYWKRTLQLDGQAAQAWQALWQAHLITPSEAYQLVHEMKFESDQEWLKDLYLARIEVVSPPLEQNTPVSSSILEETNNHNNTHNMSHMFQDMSTIAPPHLDQSSIQLSSPLPNFSTPGMVDLTVASCRSLLDGAQMTTSRNIIKNPGNTVALNNTSTALHKDVQQAYERVCKQYNLQQSPQVLALNARRAYRNYQWQKALQYCQALAQLDPTLGDVAFLYISTLVALGHKRVLFRVAHEWVEAQPKAAHSWYAVGAYYLVCERYHIAQRHFCRATRLDPHCSDAWLAFGCAFAACDESDQALASFRAAQRLSPGESSSLLYMGMEYIRTNHLVLARYFLQAAWKASAGDPLCAHEMGVLLLQQKDYNAAQQWFSKALAMVAGGSESDDLEELLSNCQDSYWEPTIFNLGHAMRKMRKFDSAKECFRRCMVLRPDQASPFAALAFTLHLQNDANGAISLYHQALGIQPDDPFCSEMLHHALQDSLSQLSLAPLMAESVSKNATLENSYSKTILNFDSSPVTERSVQHLNFNSVNMSEDMDTSDVDMSAI